MTAPIPFGQWLQMRLTAHGFACGGIDGIVGPLTVAAIKAFEASRGLPVDGMADEAVVNALRSPSSRVDDETAKAVEHREPSEAEIQKIALVGNTWPRQSGVPSFYGAVGTRQTRIEIPFDMFLAWDKGHRCRTVTLHEKVAPSAERVLQRVAQLYSAQERADLGINLFAGSLNVRRMRGGSSYSMHSWGIAIDFDSERNQLKWGKPKARLSHADALPFWQAWEVEGWLSLGRARNYDWMHVQAARL
ncbi:M15 family metallopeptidase [Aurantimonas sp. 22II-16-19i]|uniref:M15 family metallopeptidase n=1 Tax=Aurantimonas sp. 22II-16-19i TaxID=1317114 RepID=UPI0009F7CD1A|nr:M15 family metallopeptidase [Aurantimonas sp. 22II-16-19i]ORE85306.1 hypothetical protein ATO4_26513 [Aurantimonas sp. 22II-16-19i]